MSSDVTVVVLLLGVVVGFVVFRRFLLWYWKVDEAVGVLREIRAALQRMEQGSTGAAPQRASQPQTAASDADPPRRNVFSLPE